MSKKIAGLFVIYFLLFIVYAIFSYSLTAPNLILSSHDTFWRFQTYMWSTFFNNRQLLTYAFTGIITTLVTVYLIIIKNYELRIKNMSADHSKFEIRKIILIFAALVTPLLISNNALSYDVFNYIFNAKMVVVYHANPHVKVALDYAFDDWTRFMHNTHTPAPYGYGWTALSLLPYVLGMGKFLPTWLIFRLFSLLSIGLLFLSYHIFSKKNDKFIIRNSKFVLFLNPLFLIELISNSHNDLWMMVPALVSLGLIISPPTAKSPTGKTPNSYFLILKILGSGLLLAFSISTKYATALLIPLWIFLVVKQFLPLTSYFRPEGDPVRRRGLSLILKNLPLLASILMFFPLLMSRSQQFHPWYLIWALVWIPLFTANKVSQLWQQALIVLSVSSLYRYLPYLWFGEYSPDIIMYQKLITWTPLLLFMIWRLKGTIVK